MLNNAQLLALRAELESDPAGVGYTGTNQADYDLLHSVGAGSPPTTIEPQYVDPVDLVLALSAAPAEVLNIQKSSGGGSVTNGPEKWDAFKLLVTSSQGASGDGVRLPIKSLQLRAFLQAIWSDANTSTIWGAIQALQTRPGTRAEALFGEGFVLDGPWEVERARVAV